MGKKTSHFVLPMTFSVLLKSSHCAPDIILFYRWIWETYLMVWQPPRWATWSNKSQNLWITSDTELLVSHKASRVGFFILRDILLHGFYPAGLIRKGKRTSEMLPLYKIKFSNKTLEKMKQESNLHSHIQIPVVCFVFVLFSDEQIKVQRGGITYVKSHS